MNKNTSKLLVLVGLGGKLLLALLSFFLNLIEFSIGAFFNFLYLPLTILVVAGFFISFLAEQNILDLIIAGGFGINMLNTLLSLFVPQLPSILLTIISLTAIAGLLAWALKLFKDSNTPAALAVVGSIVISFGITFLSTLLARTASPSTFSSVYTLISSAVSIASAGALAFAAFLDYQS